MSKPKREGRNRATTAHQVANDVATRQMVAACEKRAETARNQALACPPLDMSFEGIHGRRTSATASTAALQAAAVIGVNYVANKLGVPRLRRTAV